MFTKFFYTCKAKGLHPTLSEWLTLQEALDKGMAGSSLTQFYYVARAILVKSETDYDKFDMAFEKEFKAAQHEPELTNQMLRWLDKSDEIVPDHLTNEERSWLSNEEVIIDKE